MQKKDRRKGSEKIVLISAMLILAGHFGFLAAQENSSTEARRETLSFRSVLNDLESSTSIQSAWYSYEKSRKEIEYYRHPGDIELSVQPGVKTQYSEEGDSGQTDLTMSTGATFVLGRSLLQEERLRTAERDFVTEKLSLDEVRRERILYLYQLYSGLWLLQQEYPILVDDKTLAEERYNGLVQLYENGAATLSEVEDGEENLQLAESGLNQNLLDQRLTWFTLEQARGLMGNGTMNEIPILEDLVFETSLNSRPVSMTPNVLNASSDYSGQQNTITTLTETMKRLEKQDWNLLLKPFLTHGDHDWAMTYSWENRNLDLNYTFPMGTFNKAEQQSVQQENWITGITLTLALGLGKTDRLDRDVLHSEMQRQQELLEEQSDRLSLELRTLYQRYIQAGDLLEQAKETSIRQSRLKEAVETRYEAGQALRTDRFSADISERRSLWKVEEARISLQQIYMSLMVLAGDISFLED